MNLGELRDRRDRGELTSRVQESPDTKLDWLVRTRILTVANEIASS